MLLIAMVNHSSFGWQFLYTGKAINSKVVVAGILISFSFTGVIGVGASVKASS